MTELEKKTEKELGNSYKQIGKLLSENIGAGIQEGSDAALEASEQLYKGLLENEQSYFDEKKRLEQAIEAAEEAQHQREYQNRLSRAKTATQAETYRQNELLRLQKKANAEYMATLQEHLDAVEAKIKAQKTIIINEFNEIAQRATESVEELERARDKMAQKMESYGKLFKEKTITFLNSGPGGSKEVFKDTVLDLSKERQELEQYAALLKEIQSQDDIPKGLFQAVREMSVKDAIQYQEALLAMDTDKRSAYIKDWEAIRKLSQETAYVSYAEDIQGTLSRVEEELADWYGTIPAEFMQEGVLSAEAFGEGFVKKLSSMQEVLQGAIQSLKVAEIFTAPSLVDKMKSAGVQNIQNTMTYVLNSAGETVSQQLRSAQAHAEILRLREG